MNISRPWEKYNNQKKTPLKITCSIVQKAFKRIIPTFGSGQPHQNIGVIQREGKEVRRS